MSKVKSTLPSSQLPPLERSEALINYYQHAYDVWSTVPGVDKEMLSNWLFLIGSLKNSHIHLVNMGLERGQHRLNEPRVTLDDLLAIEDMEDRRELNKNEF